MTAFAHSPSDSSPLWIVLALLLIYGWYTEIIDMKGAFLHGRFEVRERIYIHIPQGFEDYYDKDVVLLLKKTVYGTWQGAAAFWRILVQAFKELNYDRSCIDPCLYFNWTMYGLVIWISWVNDCLCVGQEKAVKEAI